MKAIKMWNQQDFQYKAFGILLSLLIVYTLYALLPFLGAIVGFIALVLYPFFLAAILYYLLRPAVRFLQKKMSIYLAILLTYCAIGAFIAFLVMFVYPIIVNQVSHFLEYQKNLTTQKSSQFFLFNNIAGEELRKIAENYSSVVLKNFIEIFSVATHFIIALVAVPFILFYMLKDDKDIYEKLLKLTPKKYISNVKDFIEEIDFTLVHFINGRVLVSLLISMLVFISFLLIGIDYPILLFLSTLIFYIIPTIGAFLAIILPLVVGFSMSIYMGIEVLIIMIVATIVEGFLITPKIMGTSLYIHPLTIILVILIAGYLFGIFGLIISIPAYALLKVFIKHINRFVLEHA